MSTVQEIITGFGPLTMDSLIPVLQDVQKEYGFLSGCRQALKAFSTSASMFSLDTFIIEQPFSIC